MKQVLKTFKAIAPMLAKRGIAIGIATVLLHVNIAVAQPLSGMFGADTLLSEISVSAMPSLKEVRRMTVVTTAYNPWDEGQTDDSPCYGPRGIPVCGPEMKVIAANFLPLGTKVIIDGELYTVYDRTAPKYKDRVDIAYQAKSDSPKDLAESKKAAKRHGLQKKEIIVLN